ncbi:hypothetical protein BvCmsKKNP014_03098 [Escherichia coli]|nr:hypothetical protein BvCmsKKNP014_03098 [Escherichia coli]
MMDFVIFNNIFSCIQIIKCNLVSYIEWLREVSSFNIRKILLS